MPVPVQNADIDSRKSPPLVLRIPAREGAPPFRLSLLHERGGPPHAFAPA
jgi:hypothetical protein